MSGPLGSQVKAEDLLEQAAEALGAVAVSVPAPLPGGASRSLWAFDARLPDGGEAPLVLLITKGTAEREWQALRAARAHGVPVAEPIWRTPDGEGVVMRRLVGETIPGRIFREERFGAARGRLLGQLAAALAAIHRIPPAEVPALAGRPSGAATELDAIEAELDR
jgi:aminoglycoside phosphotransferase (APT) family kinase protein